MASRLFVGVSGFSYASWKGRFYPKELRSDDFLTYFSQRLNSVEINSSFYASPSQSVIRSWAGKTGDGFRFAFKATRKITHILKLNQDSVETAIDMSKTLSILGEKRGPILFQLPPFLRQNLTLLENFLVNTSGIVGKVFEFRHASWLVSSTFDLLDKYGSGFCIAETEDLEPVFKVTGGTAYFRLRKDAYDTKTVESWAEKIRKTIPRTGDSYVYLRHDETGENAELAQKLRASL
jgi:uncharacterized protein YecE (DUF72 family)